ncbi:MAG: hypothetical protein Greene101449_642 [Candidatus Peregrinibacteria bacterium Greene1014_49]|nr:MAG: hypothetical protein Greene101449_642 [Candidatus Peregrinibacteria bacterium Greene1014_49]
MMTVPESLPRILKVSHILPAFLSLNGIQVPAFLLLQLSPVVRVRVRGLCVGGRR